MSESNAQSRPVIRMAIGPRSSDDRERFQEALRNIAQKDSVVRLKMGTLDGGAMISGMSELHLERICDQISHEFKIQIDVGQPKVIHLETVRNHSEAEGTYIRQVDGAGNYGHVKIALEPNETDKGVEFINGIRGRALPTEYIQPTEQGIREALRGGVLAGYEVVDVKVTLLEGSYHNVDSNEMAFRITGSMACKEAMRKAKPILLEPVMAVEVVVQEDYMGTIISGLHSRRGRIKAIENRAGPQVVKASVPLSEMLGYAKRMSASTKGTGDIFICFACYEETPSPRGDWGGDEPGVTANKPRSPRGTSGSAAAKLDDEFE